MGPPGTGAARRGVSVTPAAGAQDLLAVRGFFQDYGRYLEAHEGMAPCVHGIEAEIAGLPGDYAPPCGGLWLARDAAHTPLGCVALRPHPLPGTAEIKRLWVAPGARGAGAGRALVLAVIAAARDRGHARVVLDTAPGMTAAHALYRELGFDETAPYAGTPMPGLLYFGRAV